MNHPTRRDAFKTSALAAAVFATGTTAQEATKPGLTVRMAEPRNLEAAFGDFRGFLTPTDQFYVRSHFAVPTLDAKAYRLKVEGAVETPLELTLADVQAMTPTTMPLTLECAGNGRVFLTPAARGLQWQFGAVGNAEWTGVPLSAILERAKPKPAATDVILIGADSGTIAGEQPSPGVIHFDRGIPLAKAMKPEVLLAYRQNGEPLTPSHGFPVRAVVGGWYGMASVKWLTRIVVAERPHQGFWQTIDYAVYERHAGGLPTLVPVAAGQPKSQIARPLVGEVVPAGKPYTVRGYAWAGESTIKTVEVSTDGGKTWAAATLTGDEKPMCWRAWEFAWANPTAGPAKLVCRCVDAAGRGQPEKRDPDRRTYVINHWIPVEVTVR